MKILQGKDSAAPAGAGLPAPSSAAADLGRLDALEKIAKSILQRLQALEERLKSVEQAPSAPAVPASRAGEKVALPAFSAPPSSSAAALDTEAVKKGLLTKMWKYLNDERSPKAA